MVHSPLLGATLRAMHHPAHVAGFGAMQDFLEQGYATFHDIDDVDYFLDRFAARMEEVFTRTCEGPLEKWTRRHPGRHAPAFCNPRPLEPVPDYKSDN